MFCSFRKKINNYLKGKTVNLLFKRNIKKDHWSILEKKVAPHDKALKHFDDFYKELFQTKWPSVRLGLLERNKQVALVNNFGDVEETEEMLKSLGALNLRSYFQWHEERYMEKLRAEVEGGDDEDVEEIEEEKPEKKSLIQDAIQKQIDTSMDQELDILFADAKKKETIKQILLENKEDLPSEIDEVEFQSLDSEIVEYDESRIIDPEIGTNTAALNEYTPATKLMGMEDYVPEGKYYQYYQVESGFKVRIEKEYLLDFPEQLKVYTFERGDVSRYPEPELCSTRVLNYYILDGASVLVALALNVEQGDYVLDMCSSPGGKCLTILQTLLPDLVVCNEKVAKRYKRLDRTLRSYLYDFDTMWKDKIKVIQGDALEIEDRIYNKILVDVPCTNDRVSLYKDENNYFQDHRIKERLQLPEMQSALLAQALKILHPGGTVVYSTCTLSPVQNDGVVHMALQQVWNETGMEFIVMDMTPALQCTRELFNYGDDLNLKYGHVVVPFLPSNFGPMYFCKIKKPSQ